MSEKPDLNAGNYSIRDLLNILDINVPVNQEELLEHGRLLIKKYISEEQPEYAEFYAKALERLLNNYSEVEKYFSPLNDAKSQYAENTLENQFYNDGSTKQKIANTLNYRKNNVSIIDENHATQAQGRLATPNVRSMPFSQGTINPILKNAFTSWVNIDSHYREIRINQASTSCTFNDPSGQIQATTQGRSPPNPSIAIVDSSTDFTFNLSESITNVTAMTMSSLEIPMTAYYPVSDKYGTNSFDISNCCIQIPPGFYPAFPVTSDPSGIWHPTDDTSIPAELRSWTLQSRINYDLSNCELSDIKMIINANTQKTSFINNDTTDVTITFYDENGLTDCSGSKSCLPGNTGSRIDSNLGWLLGFRQPKYTIPKKTTKPNYITSEAVVNPWGTRYLLLEVDDLNRNRNSGNLISMSSNKDKLKLPEYYNKTRQLYPACSKTDVSGINFKPSKRVAEKSLEKKRPCRKGMPPGTPLVDGSNNLTNAQKYTITEILNRRKTQNQSRYNSPVNTNILFRMPISRSSNNVLTGNETPTIINNDSGLENARQYFGPVDIKTLKVKLLNDKGYPIDLRADWSFSLLVERKYQY